MLIIFTILLSLTLSFPNLSNGEEISKYDRNLTTGLEKRNKGFILNDRLRKSEFSSRQERLLLISQLEKSFISLHSIFPKLTPKEEEWLKSERDALKNIQDVSVITARANAILNSEIYLREFPHDFITGNLSLVKCIKENTELLHNISCWADLSQRLSNRFHFNRIEKLFNLRGHNPGRLPKLIPLTIYSFWGENISSKITIPFLLSLQKSNFQ